MDFLEEVKILLDLEDTTVYDTKLNMYINASITKLGIEGIPEPIDNTVDYYYDYIVVLSMNARVLFDMSTDVVVLNNLLMGLTENLRLKTEGL
jgi:hypothetical protein